MNGWKKMKFPFNLLFIIVTMFTLHTRAEDKPVEELPTMEFLEFLGEWEDDEGEWVDPKQFEGKTFEQTDTPIQTKEGDNE